MSALMAWFDFGKYSLYVWPAYGIVLCALLTCVLVLTWQKKRTITQLKKWVSVARHE